MLSFRFGTVGSPQATPKNPGGSVGGVKYSRSIGLDALELAWVQGVRVSETTCATINATAKETNVAISVHAPYYINLNCDEEKWLRLRLYLTNAAYFGNLAGATDIVFHPGSYFGRPFEEVIKVVVPRLQGIQDEIREAGNPVTLRPETMGKIAVIGSLEDSLQLAKAVEGVIPCMDFAHLHARTGNGTMNTYQEWMQVLKTYQNELGTDSINHMHIHLSGINYGPKGEKNHLILEEADMDFKALFLALQDSKASGRIMCESPVMEVDALKFKTMWMDLSGEKQD
jgi:deoxyribonuclease-4